MTLSDRLVAVNRLRRCISKPSCLLLTTKTRDAQSKIDSTAAFTLIEALVVLVIIGLIMGLVAPSVLNYLSSSKEKAAHLQVKALSNAIDLYYLDTGRYPASTEGLQALVQKPATVTVWSGPYIKDASVPLDPWGNGKDTLGYALIPHGLPNGENRPLVYRRSEEHDGLFFRTDRPTYAYYAWSEFPPDNARKMGGQFRDVVAWVPKNDDAPIPTTQPLNTNASK